MPVEELILTAEPWHYGVACVLLAAAALRGLVRFVRSARHSRLFTDLPIAPIRSASQGYVHLQGRARMMAGEPVLAPLSGKPCVWYRFVVEQHERDPEHDPLIGGWQSTEEGISEAIFALDDGTGRCIIDPDGAEVTPSTKVVWRGREPRPGYSPKATRRWNLVFGTGPYRYTEWRIHQDDRLGAVGLFETPGSGPASGADDEVRELLSSWKKDRANLLRRFDENRDGTVDLQEWEEAQRAAERAVADGDAQQPAAFSFHLLKKPRDGKPFFLFADEPAALAVRHRRQAVVGAVLFLGLATILAWVLYVRFRA